MKAALLVTLLLAAASMTLAAPQTDTSAYVNCSASHNYSLTATDVDMGCSGYGGNLQSYWDSYSTYTRTLALTINTEQCCDILTVYVNGVLLGTYSGAPSLTTKIIPAGHVVVFFKTDPSTQRTGWKAELRKAPTIHALTTGQTTTTSAAQSGGFIYFALDGMKLGSLLNMTAQINSYQGLKPPALFVANGFLPTLELYQYTAEAHTKDAGYEAVVAVNNPTDGYWYAGVYMYGTSASVAVSPRWTYSPSTVKLLTNGVLAKGTVAANTRAYYQLTCGKGARHLVIEVSREVPGGAVVVYVSEGMVPTETSYLQRMDTASQNYYNYVIEYANKNDNKAPNPGNYVFMITAPANGGYLIKATWTEVQ